MNTKEASIQTLDSPTLFQRIIDPFWQLVGQADYCPVDDAAKKLDFGNFVRLLLYFYLKGLDSLRSLITDLKDVDVTQSAGLLCCGLSTVHDAFARYQSCLFQRLYQALLDKLPLHQIKEFCELGKLACIDSSIFPMAIHRYWAIYKKRSQALKMHLCLSLNQMLPVCFLITAAKIDDRPAFRELIERGVTYIADRGYLHLKLFAAIVEQQAHFVIRIRKNLHYRVEQVLNVQLIDSVKLIFLNVTDEIVRFDCDPYHKLYRRICFQTRNALFVLVTDRLDLSTFEVIKLYCLRWQIELFFRYFKRTVGARHLINTNQQGVTIQFYVILIVHLLLVAFKQQQYQLCLFEKRQMQNAKVSEQQKQIIVCQNKVFHSTEAFVAEIGKIVPEIYKIRKQEWRNIQNRLLKKENQILFDFL